MNKWYSGAGNFYNGYEQSKVDYVLLKLFTHMKFDSTKEEYFYWVKEWKNVNKSISKQIKNLRYEIKTYYNWNNVHPDKIAMAQVTQRQREKARLIRAMNTLYDMRRMSKIMAKISAENTYARLNDQN